MKLKKYLVTLLISTSFCSVAQVKIGNNPQNINPSSVLELESATKVLVITRMNTVQMNAITATQGGMVYNTDTGCVHYHNGLNWLNLCDGLNNTNNISLTDNGDGTFTFTDGGGTQVNFNGSDQQTFSADDATMVVTQNGDDFGFRVGIVKSAQIGDFSIGSVDIQNNAITQDKLADASVGAGELRDGEVGSTQIADGGILPVDIAPGGINQVLVTTDSGITEWVTKTDLEAAVTDQATITGSGTTADPFKIGNQVLNEIIGNTDAILANDTDIADNTVNITANTTAIVSNDTNIAALNTTTAINATNIAANTASITANATAIVSNDTDIAALNATSATNVIDIGANTANITANTTAIVSNDTDIAALNATSATNVIDIGANTAAITALNSSKEDVANKSNDTALGNSTTLYPTQNAVKNYVDNAITSSEGLDNDTSPTNEIQDLNQVLTAGADAGNTIITNLGTPINANDATTKTYVDNAIITSEGLDNDTSITNEIQNLNQVLTTGADAGNTIITNLGAPVNANDATTKTYVDNAITISAGLDNDTSTTNEIQNLNQVLTVGADAGNTIITNLGAPVNASDAATKQYIDNAIATPVSTLAPITGSTIAGQFFISDANGGLTPIPVDEMFFDITNNRIGFNTDTPQQKFHVASEVRGTSFASSQGTENQPAYSFYTNDDANTGMYRIAADRLGFSTGGTNAVTIDPDQNVGIGTNTTPTSKLDVAGALALPVTNTTTNITLDNTHHTLIIDVDLASTDISIEIPDPNTCKGRIYILKIFGNFFDVTATVPYMDSNGGEVLQATALSGVIWLQSNGSIWHQVN